MKCHLSKKSLRDFYEEEAKLSDHQGLMYARGDKHEVWWHRKRLYYIFCFLAEMLRNPKVMTFADIGCAGGYYMNRVALLRNDTFCIGADIAKTYIKKAKRKAYVKKPNVDFVLCDVENLPFRKNCFGIVLCSEVLEHVPNYGKALTELEYTARRYLIISSPEHSYIYEFSTRIRPLKRLIDKVEAGAGHVSEVTIENMRSLIKTHEFRASMQIMIGGALPLQLSRTVPSIKLVDAIDNVVCKIIKRLNALDYATIHVIKVLKEEQIV